MGSRNSQTTTYWLGEQTQVVCGCYTGTLEEFKARIDEVYPDGKYGEQYRKYIKQVEGLMAQGGSSRQINYTITVQLDPKSSPKEIEGAVKKALAKMIAPITR